MFHSGSARGRRRLTVPSVVVAGPGQFTWESAKALLKPYAGESTVNPADVSSLNGKVVVGYQGWFATPCDGGPLGWVHYQYRAKAPDQKKVCIDFWPDVTDLSAEEKCETKLKHADGSPAYRFSSRNPKTVNRHFPVDETIRDSCCVRAALRPRCRKVARSV